MAVVTDKDVASAKEQAGIVWPYTFALSKSREVLGETYKAITLREPTAAEFVKFGLFDDKITGDEMLDFIAVLSGLTPGTIRQMPGTDMLRLSRRLMQVFTEAAQ
jgi:hypothetical protein